MSISVNMEIKDELVEIPVATTKFFRTYWELAIKECEIKLFREGACFGKEQLHEILRELEHLSNWVENYLLGSEYDYMHKRIELLKQEIPKLFERNETGVIYID